MPVFLQNVNSTELRISFTAPFSQEQVSKIKTIKGRRWYPTDRYWAVPYTEETVKYLICVFAEDVLFDSDSLTKDGNFILESVQTSDSKEDGSDLWHSRERRLDAPPNTSSVKNYERKIP